MRRAHVFVPPRASSSLRGIIRARFADYGWRQDRPRARREASRAFLGQLPILLSFPPSSFVCRLVCLRMLGGTRMRALLRMIPTLEQALAGVAVILDTTYTIYRNYENAGRIIITLNELRTNSGRLHQILKEASLDQLEGRLSADAEMYMYRRLSAQADLTN
ncbi:hypothetical protein EVAR_18779_1 [Eumeta japonica]|uniref:Uncharacterized protein n=1 Tax=Eumeta variegata TaxID=151549 RepID=A0A4C1ULI1_EUMVA|nr:hypothetical protein EVAR_18779_1 [Eumeta japonica]